MKTIKIDNKVYSLGKFSLVHLLPFANFMNCIQSGKKISLELWEEVAEIIKDHLVPDIEEYLVNPLVKRGIYLKSEDLQTIYTTAISYLKEIGEFKDLDIETGEEVKERQLSKEEQIKALESQLNELKQ
jgi:hypothetical protein